ncbi:Tn3 family transposase [Microtetraspora niveoalba]|uniref:Tn3 family transposase n=1 Tax=Microtetraspora niveoalba TaxID=46175 RepID=UPI0035714CCA
MTSSPATSLGKDAVGYTRWTQEWYVREETLREANTCLVNHRHALGLSKIFGGAPCRARVIPANAERFAPQSALRYRGGRCRRERRHACKATPCPIWNESASSLRITRCSKDSSSCPC